MNTYNLTLSPSDRKILESKLLDEINNGQDNFVIDEIDRNSSILTFYTNNTLDSDAITEINQYIIDHIPEWDLPVLMQPTTGGEVTADNPLVTANDPIFNTIPHNHSDLNMDDGPNPHGITKSDLSLENVDNTSDIDKPVSTAQQTAINSAQQSAETYADGLIESIKGASPTTLDTLYEIASALQNNPDIITNIVNALGKRLRVDVNNQGLSALEKTNAKTNLSLENVDNTSDANKPISSATQTALNAKLESTDIANFETSTELNARDANNRDRANHTGTQAAATISDFGSSVEGNTQVALNTTHRGLTNNPHTVTKTQVGLGNVDNTSDADKPISSATQTALNGKINTSLIGAASGVASLGTDGKVPVGQLPTMTGTITSYYVQNTITSSTTSSTYQTYLTFTPDGSFPAGDYLVIANGQYSTSASLSTLKIALFSGSTELTDTTIRAGYFKAASANRLSYHMMTKLSLTSASAVSIRFLSNATNNTATLYTGKIYLQKL